ncbi:MULTISPECIES: polyprenol phosphomannose-dependent alpha 1,6 mannosyltransferase MptB [unclassified Pseudarthrobacter]|uniref:polyprenol phosphomannose-dependent alpha 1,6 mannosyltransferase MptB n=1 Tax=unclassified Pseudarthrobacter TaxID=2647000 RepID=UPI003CC54E48
MILAERKSTRDPLTQSLMAASRSTILQGLLGSVLMALASIGLGWLAGSSGFIRTPLFIFARTSPIAVIASTIMLCVGALLLLRAWLRLAQRMGDWDRHCIPVLRKAFWMWTLPLMACLPLFSRDVYAYIGQGRLMTHGLDPYTNGISALSNYYNLGPDTLWTEAPTPYGPLWLWIEQASVAVSFEIPEVAIIPFRFAVLAGLVLLAVYAPKLAALNGFNPQRTLWLVALNPVVLINFIASTHNDSLMLGLCVAGIYFTAVKRPILGIVLVTASIAIKPITLIALPFVGLLWAGHKAGWSRRFLCWAGTLALSMGLLAVAGLVNGLGFGWIGALQTSSAVWIWYAPVGLLSHMLGLITSLMGVSGDPVIDAVQMVGTVASILIVIWLTLRPADTGQFGVRRWSGGFPADVSETGYRTLMVRRAAWAFAAVVLLAPMIQPWYMIWLLALFAVTGIDEGWQLRAVFYLTTFFVLIALTDQLSVFRWIPIELVRAVAIAVGVSMAAYLMFFDEKTHVLFRQPRKA